MGTNRQRTQQPRGGHSHWCKSCDKEVVHDGSKCTACGSTDGRKRFKHKA